MTQLLSPEVRGLLLRLARQALEAAVHGRQFAPPALDELPPECAETAATFVTLTIHGHLRGCIGALEAYQPLALDVCEHAVAAGTQDYRFPPMRPAELAEVKIEISRLTAPAPLEYAQPADLPAHLRPHVDGVILKDGWRRATFLPQVWDSLPEPEEFLAHLCQKMGAAPDAWRRKKLEVALYQVEEFSEPG